MTTGPQDPQPAHDPDLEPALDPADAADQQREVWDTKDLTDDEAFPDEERPVAFDEDEPQV